MTDSNNTAGDWCTIESDPGVFTELLNTLGATTVELQELYSLDDVDSLRHTNVYGLVFLFQWIGHQERSTNKVPLPESSIPPGLFFAHQVTTNACATQALLSVVLNASLSEPELGPVLSEFKSFAAEFPPHLKGVAISGSQEIKTAHNAFARPDAFLQDATVTTSNVGEAFHFVAYVPYKTTVYELDGLQSGPIDAGTFDEETAWLDVARAAIQERMNQGGDHIKFNLMAVIQDKRISLNERLQELVDEDSKAEYQTVVAELAAEEQKRDRYKVENQRRAHNYVPLCVQLLKELARLGTLPTLMAEANERQAAKQSKKLAFK
jgi:ubiquitin carboxyl-terminal hydrolase L5